ncbi:30S ribosomal protein S8 [Borreliella afzelii]|uniref:Small ribosomal subunit protein uS8 n=2 Tax=Borreliella afzelii TaxID=29518 RepID=RS8_BORAP|nr:30S ribosomal protein S8 [Borreliella afzelii]Q0SN15.1 RecName: Full=Small ribosomal subunit protein uS8; AltName: Full=30S ribosomal protein S8 [Borreliella afzelii PKo]AFU74785.1 30S ribosomal protein S8 [Borreliella afzelii HLJ01]AJY72473.1 ribosomal S8 family protein [Borreliella afzelii K78]EEC21141.1 ribosomal protein S8 [Borreliella afzelii ACA-1]ABH01763.1 ribosomal protein S8 [Borreliella afzelii PKo]AEL69716.1 30S ribosomal protein S8 [Borreliella afzelii PKo]
MAITHSVGDMLTKLRNASRVKHGSVDLKMSNMNKSILNILKKEGYIKDFNFLEKEGITFIRVLLKYDNKRNPVINKIDAISTPGRKIYSSYKNMPRIKNGYGILIISSSQGVITGKEAKDKKIGGELICSVW